MLHRRGWCTAMFDRKGHSLHGQWEGHPVTMTLAGLTHNTDQGKDTVSLPKLPWLILYCFYFIRRKDNVLDGKHLRSKSLRPLLNTINTNLTCILLLSNMPRTPSLKYDTIFLGWMNISVPKRNWIFWLLFNVSGFTGLSRTVPSCMYTPKASPPKIYTIYQQAI